MGIVDDLIVLADSDIVAQLGTVDGSGTWSPSGDPVTLRARIEAGSVNVPRQSGQEIATGPLAVVFGLLASNDTRLMRFTLPDRFVPNVLIQASRIEPVSDETGPIYTEVYFP